MEIDNDTTDFNNDNFEQQYESESDENGGEAFSHDLDSSDTDAEDECDLAEEIQEHEFIYNGSRLTVKEFNLSYLSTIVSPKEQTSTTVSVHKNTSALSEQNHVVPLACA